MNTGVTPPGHGQKPACTLQSALVCEGPPHPWANQPQACRVSSWKPMLFKVNRPVSLGLWILWLKDISELLGSLGLRSIGRARNQASNYTRVPRCESTGGWGAACRDSGEGRGPRAWRPPTPRAGVSCTERQAGCGERGRLTGRLGPGGF